MAQDVHFLDIDLLQPNPLQPRGLITPESLTELADSIREHGILEPLVVAKTPAGYQIIAGERRWRAGKIAGLTQVPVVIRETTPQGMLEMAIVENVQRIDLNPLERAQAYKRLMDEFGLTNQEIARRVGKSPSFISNTIRLMSLPDALKDGLLTGMTTEGHVRALAAIDEPALMVEAYKVCLRDNLSVRGAEELARQVKTGIKLPKQNGQDHSKKTVTDIQNEGLSAMQNNVISVLRQKARKANVALSQSRVQARIVISVNGKPEETTPIVQELYRALIGTGSAQDIIDMSDAVPATAA